MSAPPDADLVAAIEQAYRDTYKRFLRVAVAVLGDLDRAHDAVQETFVRALRSRGDLRHIESLSGWLWRTLMNVCLAERRHARDQLAVTDRAATNGHAEDWPEVRAMIAALPERQRTVLFLRHYADLDYQRIAAIVGVERGTVAATLHTAHRKIREAMTEVLQ